MAKTITISKLIEKLQNLMDEEGDLKVLFANKEERDVTYGTIHPNPGYEGDMDVDQDQQLLVIYPNETLTDTDELLSDASDNKSRSVRSRLDEFSDPDEEEEEEDEDEDYYRGNTDDFMDKDMDDWEYHGDDE